MQTHSTIEAAYQRLHVAGTHWPRGRAVVADAAFHQAAGKVGAEPPEQSFPRSTAEHRRHESCLRMASIPSSAQST